MRSHYIECRIERYLGKLRTMQYSRDINLRLVLSRFNRVSESICRHRGAHIIDLTPVFQLRVRINCLFQESVNVFKIEQRFSKPPVYTQGVSKNERKVKQCRICNP